MTWDPAIRMQSEAGPLLFRKLFFEHLLGAGDSMGHKINPCPHKTHIPELWVEMVSKHMKNITHASHNTTLYIYIYITRTSHNTIYSIPY